jgi:LacI family transcriptional regulator, gluconate utilization system Gnt-I transcriptional repressor
MLCTKPNTLARAAFGTQLKHYVVKRNPSAKFKMEDIAQRAGVSLMTVSRALRVPDTVAPTTLKRILDVVNKVGYVPDSIAGGLASKRSGFVSLLVPSINNLHFAETAAALKAVLTPAGLQVLLGITNYEANAEERLVETMLRRRPEAMVLTNDGHSQRTRKLLTEAGVPVIDTWEMPKRLIATVGHAVGFSNKAAAKSMTDHLITRGYEKIGYLGEIADVGTRGHLRREGFVAAMQAAGLDDTRQVSLSAPPVGMLAGRAAFDALIQRWPDTQAVMCVSDPCAFGALSSCQLRGWPVPERMAIAGFGAFEISASSVPAITTVDVSGKEIGDATGRLLLSLLDPNQSTIESQKIQIATKVMLREST